jgi:hypothetical protein
MIKIESSYSGRFGQVYEGKIFDTYFKATCLLFENGDCLLRSLKDIETEYKNKTEIKEWLEEMGLINN